MIYATVSNPHRIYAGVSNPRMIYAAVTDPPPSFTAHGYIYDENTGAILYDETTGQPLTW